MVIITNAKYFQGDRGFNESVIATIDGVETLIREADTALYKGKDQGRNCVVSSVHCDPVIKV